MHFGIYLTENGLISCEQFMEALKHQLSSRPLLGALAIETEKLSVKQVFHILRIQAETPGELFGELAVEQGFLTEADVASLILLQSMRVRPLAQIIVELGFASADEVDRHQIDFRNAKQPSACGPLATAAP